MATLPDITTPVKPQLVRRSGRNAAHPKMCLPQSRRSSKSHQPRALSAHPRPHPCATGAPRLRSRGGRLRDRAVLSRTCRPQRTTKPRSPGRRQSRAGRRALSPRTKLQDIRLCQRRDSNPRHADYDLSPEAQIGSAKRILAQEIWPVCEPARPSREILGNPCLSSQLVGRSESLEVYTVMSQLKRPTGHLQVKTDKNGRTRSFWAFWRDCNDRKGGRCLGPAHVRDSGRRTSRGAVIWRAGHGPKPSPEYLTPKEAQACLETILEELRTAAEVDQASEHTLQQAV
jgi:hypothetical protein